MDPTTNDPPPSGPITVAVTPAVPESEATDCVRIDASPNAVIDLVVNGAVIATLRPVPSCSLPRASSTVRASASDGGAGPSAEPSASGPPESALTDRGAWTHYTGPFRMRGLPGAASAAPLARLMADATPPTNCGGPAAPPTVAPSVDGAPAGGPPPGLAPTPGVLSAQAGAPAPGAAAPGAPGRANVGALSAALPGGEPAAASASASQEGPPVARRHVRETARDFAGSIHFVHGVAAERGIAARWFSTFGVLEGPSVLPNVDTTPVPFAALLGCERSAAYYSIANPELWLLPPRALPHAFLVLLLDEYMWRLGELNECLLHLLECLPEERRSGGRGGPRANAERAMGRATAALRALRPAAAAMRDVNPAEWVVSGLVLGPRYGAPTDPWYPYVDANAPETTYTVGLHARLPALSEPVGTGTGVRRGPPLEITLYSTYLTAPLTRPLTSTTLANAAAGTPESEAATQVL